MVNLNQLKVSDGRQLNGGWRGSVGIRVFGSEGAQQKEMSQRICVRELELTVVQWLVETKNKQTKYPMQLHVRGRDEEWMKKKPTQLST